MITFPVLLLILVNAKTVVKRCQLIKIKPLTQMGDQQESWLKTENGKKNADQAIHFQPTCCSRCEVIHRRERVA